MRVWIALLLVASAPALCEQRLGIIEFPNSGDAAAQDPFLRGVLLLHNFEYDDAATAFREAQEADPGFLLAYWGEAMSHYRPVWGRENLEKGRAALSRGSEAEPGTARERAYLEAARIVFGEGERADRWARYTDAMRRLAAAHPDDLEAASLYAVSMFGTTGGKRDTRTYMKIAAIAEDVYLENEDHPGALHYLIHSFDDPIHAPLGLRYARRYSSVASSAPHAQHMPSHVFLALGMWDECISSNIDSWNSSEARVKRLGLGSDDRGYHALWWMQYAYLQKRNFEKARENLAVIESDAAESGSRLARSHHAYMRSQLMIDAQQWDADLAPVDDEGIDDRGWGSNALAEGMRAVKTGRPGAARQWLAKVRNRKGSSRGAESLPIVALELEALLLLNDKKVEEAVGKLREATEIESGTAFGYGPPFPAKPSFELLGDVLLTLDRPAEAKEAYEASLQRTPRRALSLLGLEKAAKAAGDAEAASRAAEELRGRRPTPNQ